MRADIVEFGDNGGYVRTKNEDVDIIIKALSTPTADEIGTLYVIELQPKCWSICSTLSETKEFDTGRTLLLNSAEVYKNECIADRHCENIKKGKFKNAKVRPVTFFMNMEDSNEKI